MRSGILSCSPPTCFYFKLPTTGAGVWAKYNIVLCNSWVQSTRGKSKARLYNVTGLIWLGASLEFKIFPCPRVKLSFCGMCSVIQYKGLLVDTMATGLLVTPTRGMCVLSSETPAKTAFPWQCVLSECQQTVLHTWGTPAMSVPPKAQLMLPSK